MEYKQIIRNTKSEKKKSEKILLTEIEFLNIVSFFSLYSKVYVVRVILEISQLMISRFINATEEVGINFFFVNEIP